MSLCWPSFQSQSVTIINFIRFRVAVKDNLDERRSHISIYDSKGQKMTEQGSLDVVSDGNLTYSLCNYNGQQFSLLLPCAGLS